MKVLSNLYNQRDATYTVFFIIIGAVHVPGSFFRPSSEAYKTVRAALGIVMLSCCLPLVWKIHFDIILIYNYLRRVTLSSSFSAKHVCVISLLTAIYPSLPL